MFLYIFIYFYIYLYIFICIIHYIIHIFFIYITTQHCDTVYEITNGLDTRVYERKPYGAYFEHTFK